MSRLGGLALSDTVGNLRWASVTTPAVAAAPSGFAARVYDGVKVFATPAGEVRALDGVSVGFEEGRFTAIMGPSGSGKSTLVQCAAGLDSLTSGTVFVGEQPLAPLNPTALTELRRDRIGFVFQAFNLVPSLTAERNILLPLTLAKREPDQALFDTIVGALGIRDRLHHRPRELSGGQQQRVAVARALVTRPELVIADEPTGNLDSRTGEQLLGFLRSAVDEWRQSVIMVTHDPRAAAHADLVLFLADGRIVEGLPSPTADSVIDVLKRLG